MTISHKNYWDLLYFHEKIQKSVRFAQRCPEFPTPWFNVAPSWAKLCQAVVAKNDQANLQQTLKKGQGVQASLVLWLIVDKMHHICLKEFRPINWSPSKERIKQCINGITFNFFNNICPFIWMKFLNSLYLVLIDTRNSFARLKHHFRNTDTGQKTLSCIDFSLWNNLPV